MTGVLSIFRLDGKVALVTGASSGIGRRVAEVLHDAGADVVVAARRLERLEEIADAMERTSAVACDVSDDEQCRALVEATIARHGHIDVLVNNAGIATALPAETEPAIEFRRVVDVNLHAAFVLSQLAGRHMLERQSGVILNVASVLGLVGTGQLPQASYAASKGALVALTRELAAQWARRGVRVNALAPGWFPTEMNAEAFADEGFVRWIRSRTPMGRPGTEGELDGAVLLLASDASSFMTGQVVVVDGGWTCI